MAARKLDLALSDNRVSWIRMKGTSSRYENRTEQLAGGARKVRRLLALAEDPKEGSSSLLDKTSEMAWLAVTQFLQMT